MLHQKPLNTSIIANTPSEEQNQLSVIVSVQPAEHIQKANRHFLIEIHTMLFFLEIQITRLMSLNAVFLTYHYFF